jgi:hypothetical protein
MKKTLLIASMSVLAGSAFALTAYDDASNYGGGWSTGDNFGSGFGLWSLSNNDDGSTVFGGNFIGDSTAGAGDINTGVNQSFGLYANPGAAESIAIRSFSTALSVGDQFSFDLGVNYNDGNKGFNLRTAGDSIFNFNVGGGASVSSDNATIVPGSAVAYDYGGNDVMIEAVLEVISASSINYQISRTSSDGFQGILFSGTVTGIVGSIDNFQLYNTGTAGGDQNNIYFNNLQVSEVPEPGTYALIAGTLALLCVAKRRRG